VASAERIYGKERLHELFGTVEPVPGDRLRALSDGDVLSLGGRELRTLYTPGHASHHVCLVDSQTGAVFVGDALGVFLPDVRILRPATPPPEFDLEEAVRSIERVAASEPSQLLFSHFGPAREVGHLCALAITRLRRWAAVVQAALGETDAVAHVVERLRQGTEPEVRPATGRRRAALEDRYELLSSYEMNAMGLIRYLQKLGREAR
jgi:glyoxylase-like metal-dependent hydrolase (beta-lactamase superfamily II)